MQKHFSPLDLLTDSKKLLTNRYGHVATLIVQTRTLPQTTLMEEKK